MDAFLDRLKEDAITLLESAAMDRSEFAERYYAGDEMDVPECSHRKRAAGKRAGGDSATEREMDRLLAGSGS